MYNKIITIVVFLLFSCTTSRQNCDPSIVISDKLNSIALLLEKEYKYSKSKIYKTKETTLLSNYIELCDLKINEAKILEQSLTVTLYKDTSSYMPSRCSIEICKYFSLKDANSVYEKIKEKISIPTNRKVVPCVEPYDLRIHSVYVRDCTILFFNEVSNLNSKAIDSISKAIESEYYK